MLKKDDIGTAPLVLALDGGTGSCRAIVFDLNGNEVAVAQREWHHPLTPNVPGGMDFDVRTNGALFDDVCAGIVADLGGKADRIAAISTTSMREGFVIYDKHDEVIWACPNIDGRAQREAQELTETGLADRVFEVGGDWVSITAPARFKWLRANAPHILDNAKTFGMLSDWVATGLTGEYATEPSAGSSTALFDLRERNWSQQLFDLLKLDASWCPPVHESGSPIGAVTKAAAMRTGLAEGTPVFAGGADTQLALLGLARRPGEATLVGGSFWQMTAVTEAPVIDPKRRARTLCHAVPGQWMIEGIGFLTGMSLRWFRDAFCELEQREAEAEGTSVFEIMERKAAEVPPGAHGLQAIFSSVMQSDSWTHGPPSFIGFDIGNPAHSNRLAAMRALMESGAFVSEKHRAIVEECTNQRFDRVVFTGGSASGSLWPQIIADTLNLPVDVSTVKETTALGAAILAASGAGLIDDVADMASGFERTLDPDAARHAIYAEKLEKWAALDAEMLELGLRGVAAPMWQAAGGVPRLS